jgi:hypothetical protein
VSLGKWFLVAVLTIAGAVHLWHVHARSVIDRELAAAVNLKQDQMSLALRTNAVMGGEIPIVLINGLAKANPSADEVAVEYRRDK